LAHQPTSIEPIIRGLLVMQKMLSMLLFSILLFTSGINAQDTTIMFDGSTITAPNNSVSIQGNTVIIHSSGSYTLTGTSADAQVIVDTSGAVNLIFDNLDLTSTTSAPIYVEDASSVYIELAEDSINTLTDSARRNDDDDDADAVIYSESDLNFTGYGVLNINAQYEDGIHTERHLNIQYGEYFITAREDGLVGEDSIVLLNTQLTIQAGDKGIKTDEDDNQRGFIQISDSILNIESGDHAIDAEGQLMVNDSEITVQVQDREGSADGIKAGDDIVFNNVIATIVSADHGIDTDGNFTLNSGDLTISVPDKGINVEYTFTMNDGIINILASEEGIEAGVIIINDGEINIVASDDGINISFPDDADPIYTNTGNQNMGGQGMGGRGQGGGGFRGNASEAPYHLTINGGLIVINSQADGLDSNGSIIMNDGTVIVHGPTVNMEGALDYDGTFTLNGGVLIAVGSAGMPQAPSENSPMPNVSFTFNTVLAGGTAINIQSADGENILTFVPAKDFQNVIFSSPDLVIGETYTISYGGTPTGDEQHGLYWDGDYSGGEIFETFTVGIGTTYIGTMGGRGRGR
jgi:hypothetical protein